MRQLKHLVMICAVIAITCILSLGLVLHNPARAHAQALTTNLTITYIAVDDQNWQEKKTFAQGNLVHFVVYVHNPSNFPDFVTLRTTVISSSGASLFNSAPWNTSISGNSTPGYAWTMTIPQSTSPGLHYFHATVQDSQGSVDRWAVFTIQSQRKSISYNPFYPNYVSQCTWKAEDLMHSATGLYMPVYGDAGTWASAASAQGWTVGNTPETASVIIMPYANGYKYWYWNGNQWVQTSISTHGHVGWVTSIGSNGLMVYVVDRNWNLNGKDGGRWFWINGAPVSFIYSSH